MAKASLNTVIVVVTWRLITCQNVNYFYFIIATTLPEQEFPLRIQLKDLNILFLQ